MSGISDSDYEHWCRDGYVVVRLVTDERLAGALDDIHEYFPTSEEHAARPRWFRHTIASPVRGPGQGVEFPTRGRALNSSTIHPEFVAFAERVMGTDRLMLSHGQLGARYAGTRDGPGEFRPVIQPNLPRLGQVPNVQRVVVVGGGGRGRGGRGSGR